MLEWIKGSWKLAAKYILHSYPKNNETPKLSCQFASAMDELDPVKGRMEYRSTDFNEDFNDGKGHILDNIFDQSEADHGNSLLNSEQSIFQMNGKPEENSRQHEGVDVFSNSYSGAPNFSSRSSMQDENDTQGTPSTI